MSDSRRPLWESCSECGHMLYQHDENCSKRKPVKVENPTTVHLDKCPFCGKSPEVTRLGIQCKKCHLIMEYNHLSTIRQLSKIWNKRCIQDQ